MEKYRKIEKKKEEREIKPNEIRITTQGTMRNYLTYAINLLTGEPTDKNFEEVILSAMGGAIVKTVSIAEIMKRRVPGLHQITEISSNEIVDHWEPIEEGLDPMETTRHVSAITIKLMKKAPENFSEVPGYQEPLDESELSPSGESVDAPRRTRGRRRQRGRRRGAAQGDSAVEGRSGEAEQKEGSNMKDDVSPDEKPSTEQKATQE